MFSRKTSLKRHNFHVNNPDGQSINHLATSFIIPERPRNDTATATSSGNNQEEEEPEMPLITRRMHWLCKLNGQNVPRCFVMEFPFIRYSRVAGLGPMRTSTTTCCTVSSNSSGKCPHLYQSNIQKRRLVGDSPPKDRFPSHQLVLA